MKRGDILFVDLENPPGGSGREQAGKRPAVAISLGDSDPNNPLITVVPMTTTESTKRFSHTLEINPSTENGLSNLSIAMGFQITSIDKRRVIKVVGKLEEHLIQQIEDLLRLMMSL